MISTVYTESGSVYELDEVQRRVRRLSGVTTPTARQSADGEWQEYAKLYVLPLAHGQVCLMFDWNGDGKCTMTSVILKMVGPDGKTFVRAPSQEPTSLN